MEAFRCNCCGDILNFQEGETTATCESCGNRQSIPKDHSEEMRRKYAKANRLRSVEMNFDAAEAAYKEILNIDENEPEANWDIVLCQYGVLYEEENGKYTPTMNRMREQSVFDNPYYKKAIENADDQQKEVYEKQAKYIDGVQRKYLLIASREKPYDVFISFKKTDETTGGDTEDCELARDIYETLSDRDGKDLKVFFSEVTLKNKAGEYEPYIYAALESAPVMVVIGSKKEYFEAKWVRNEWQRFLLQIAERKDKVIIPVYRDMPIKELPQELMKYQATELTSNSNKEFTNLIDKIDREVKSRKEVPAAAPTTGSDGSEKETLKRGLFEALRNGRWADAERLVTRILDWEQTYAEGYLAQLMIERKVTERERLGDCIEPLKKSKYFPSILHYADVGLHKEIIEYEAEINRKNLERRKEAIYADAIQRQSKISNAREAQIAEAQFQRVAGYKDTEAKAQECRVREEELRLQEERADAQEQEAEARVSKRWMRANIVVAVIIVGAILAVIIAGKVVVPARQYDEAKELLRRGMYEEAYELLSALGKDDDIQESKYDRAVEALRVGDYTLAYELLSDLGDYQDAAELALESQYARGMEYLEEENYTAAYALLEQVGSYQGADQLLLNSRYERASAAAENGNYAEAVALYDELGTYQDSASLAEECRRAYVEVSLEAGDYLTTYELYLALGEEEAGAALLEAHPWIGALSAGVGETVTLGHYEQDNNAGDGTEPVEWIVLMREEERVLLISRDILAHHQFHTDVMAAEDNQVTWENSAVREWMDTALYEGMFSAEEKERILLSTLYTPFYGEGTRAVTTEDHLFLLSYEEYGRYESMLGDTSYTAYCLSNYSPDFGNVWWWIRTVGSYERSGIAQYEYALINGGVSYTATADRGIRPALWFDISPMETEQTEEQTAE